MGFIASAILGPLCKRLINTAWQEYELVRDVKEEVGKLRFTVFLIQDVLQDAEQKQVKEGVVRDWLRSLKQLLYDAEDILDEAATDSRSVYLNSIGEILSRRDLAHQIKHVRMKLDDIYKEKDALRLEGLITSENIWPPVNTKRRRVDTSSLLMADEPCIVGRDDEKRKIIQMLMGSELEYCTGEPTSSTMSNVHVLSLVGMGGVGKTTLAKLVFNNPTVKQHFHVMMWVCVSENFDVNRITKEILEVLSPGQQKESFEILTNWDSAQQRLKAKIEGKKFMLVLDDVWEQDPIKWESLYGPLTYGGKGSRIIVTTRNQRVSNMVKASCVPLKSLSDEDLWPILKCYAFDGGSESYGLLESIGRRMVTKLKGSPLAAKTIGRLLSRSLDVRHWKDILDSEIFMLPQQPNDISPVLKLSYDHLPGHLKQCFAYCSLFPKDYEFSRSELAPHWLAQNFIQTPRGDQHFDDLLDMSFFEESTYKSKYVMHDLIHDLAESISEGDCLRLGDDVRPNEFPETIRHVSIATEHLDPMKLEELCKYGKLRTLHFLWPPRFDLSPLLLDNLFTKLKRLRVLGLRHCEVSELPTSIGNLKHLRFVDLSYTHGISELPESFCGLHNLQVLRLRGCSRLRSLPGNMSALVNLMHLEPSDHDLVSSIQDLGKLTALQELNIRGVKAKELGDMSMLRHLHIRNLEEVTGKEEAAKARLDAKKNLETLSLGWRDDDYETSEEEEAEEEEEEGVLEGLQPVEEEGVLEGLQPADSVTKLIIYNYGGVRSPRWLEDPSWVSSSLLERVELAGCKNWEVLPPLGQLCGLKKLKIIGMSSLRRIDPGKGGGGGFEMLGFPSLESLNFAIMPEWEGWEAPHHGDDDDEEGQQQQISFLPRLRTLKIRGCPKLKELPPLPHSLECLKIRRVGLTRLSRLVGCCGGGGGGAGRDADHMPLSELYIKDCPNLRSLDDDEGGQQQQISFLPRLHTLTIGGCPKLKELPPLPRSLKSLSIWKVGLTRFPRRVGCCGGAGRDADHVSLSELSISDCPNLRSLNDDDDGLLQHPLPVLSSLYITGCMELTSLPVRALAHFTSLQELEISDCPKLSSSSSSLPSVSTADEAKDQRIIHSNSVLITTFQFPTTGNKKVDDGDDDDEEGQQQQQIAFLPRLRTLYIRDCPKLKELPPLPRSLESLEIKNVGLTRLPRLVGCCGGGGDADAGRDADHMSLSELSISDCPNLRSLDDDDDDDGLLQHPLPRLSSLSITGCRELTSFPDTAFAHFTFLKQLQIRDCPKLSSSSSSSSSLPSVSTADEASMPRSMEEVSILDGGDMVEYLLVASILPKLTRLSVLRVSVGSSSTAQLLINSILQNQPVTATLESLEIRRDRHHDQQHQACSSSSNIPSLIVPPAPPPPPPPLEMEKVVVGPTNNNIRDHLTSLASLKIQDCSDLLQLSGLPSSLIKELRISHDTHLDDGILATYLQGMCRLTSLSIEGCPDITSLPTAEVLCHLTALEDLTIRDCKELTSLGGGVHTLIALQTLTIEDCPKLLLHLVEASPAAASPSSSAAPTITLSSSVAVYQCGSISPPPTMKRMMDMCLRTLDISRSSPRQITMWLRQCSSLQRLRIQSCPQLTCFDGDDDVNRELAVALLNQAASLRQLCIVDCENLRSLPSKLRTLSSLEMLVIEGCPKIQCLPSAGLPESLQYLSSYGCPELGDISHVIQPNTTLRVHRGPIFSP